MKHHENYEDLYSILSLLGKRQTDKDYLKRVPKRYLKEDYKIVSLTRSR